MTKVVSPQLGLNKETVALFLETPLYIATTEMKLFTLHLWVHRECDQNNIFKLFESKKGKS